MNEIIFATNSSHKLHEVQHLIGDKFVIISLEQVGYLDDIPETADTLEGNALLKARIIHNKFGKNCFADDTGLEVEALDGKPGVLSARYADEGHDFEANIDKLLVELQNKPNRKARFRTVIALIINNSEYLFEGIVEGEIINERKGKQGFGYDPVFLPSGFDQTFAEMPLSIKNKISHRAKAIKNLIDFLQS